eukprot:m.95146 g.95146  ORF g.95146 m.95146 type:complete len:730 (-) comp10090_c0_seq2:103-2292(-)
MAHTDATLVSRVHGDVLVSLCAVASDGLNPATRLDLAVGQCDALVDYGTSAAQLSLGALEYIAREQMLTENTRNEESLCLTALSGGGADVAAALVAGGEGATAESCELTLKQLADTEWVCGEAARLRVTVGTFVCAILKERCGSAWEAAFSHVFGALSTPTTLHTAIESGDFARARDILTAHPTWYRWKHRGNLPLHAACHRSANWTVDEETCELHPLPTSTHTARVALIEALVAADATTVHVRTDSNWSLGVANGVTPLQLAVLAPSVGHPADPVPPLDVDIVKILLQAGGDQAATATVMRHGSFTGVDQPWCVWDDLAQESTVSQADVDRLKRLCASSTKSTAAATSNGSRGQGVGSERDGSGSDGVGVMRAVRSTVDSPPPPQPEPAHGADMTPTEFQNRLSDATLGDLVRIEFFDTFSPDEQRLMFRLAALVRASDCINTPSRTTAERHTATRGESVVESFLTALRVDYTTEEENKAVLDELRMAYVATPDVLFSQGAVELPGVRGTVRWVDSKNGWFVPGLSLPSKMNSLQRQMLKYVYYIGPGLILWHKGYFESILDVTPSQVRHASIATSTETGEPGITHCQRGQGTYTVKTLRVKTRLLGRIIGRRGDRIRQVEADHGVLLVIPAVPSNERQGGGARVVGSDSADMTLVDIVGCSKTSVSDAEAQVLGFLRPSTSMASTKASGRQGRTGRTGQCVEEPGPARMIPPQLARRGYSMPASLVD